MPGFRLLVVSGLAIALAIALLLDEPALMYAITRSLGKPAASSALGHVSLLLPLALFVLGIAGVVTAAARIWLSSVRPPSATIVVATPRAQVSLVATGSERADAAAVVACVCGVAALLLMAVPFALPNLMAHIETQPCTGPLVTADCLDSHPDFYHRQPGGNYTTASSELAMNVQFLVWVAWPAALAAAIAGALALRFGSRLRRTALVGVILGAAVVVWLPASILGFWIAGGGE